MVWVPEMGRWKPVVLRRVREGEGEKESMVCISLCRSGEARRCPRCYETLRLCYGNKVGDSMTDCDRADYDEEDDGFMFTRTRSKRTKATPAVQVPEPILEVVREEAARPAVARKLRKKSIEAISTAAPAKEMREPTRRRSARNSGDSVTIEPPPLEVKKKRPKQKGASRSNPIDEREVQLAQGHAEPQDSVAVVGEVPGIQRQEYDRSKDVTKIALPFADTPIIRRNKEMRKGTGDGTRRSSLGMRGRRASSLIDSGKSNGRDCF